MLQSYKTGTQREKEWNRPHQLPKADEIGPFDEIIIDSPEHMAKEVFHKSKPKPKLGSREEVVYFKPDYIHVGLLLNASGFDPSKSHFVGFRLLEHLRNSEPVDYNTLPQRISAAQSEWQKLLKEAETRSVRRSKEQLQNLGKKWKSPEKISEETVVVQRETRSVRRSKEQLRKSTELKKKSKQREK